MSRNSSERTGDYRDREGDSAGSKGNVFFLISTIALALSVALANGIRESSEKDAVPVHSRAILIRDAVTVCMEGLPKITGKDGKLFVRQDDLRSCVIGRLCGSGKNKGLMGEGCEVSDEELRRE